MRLKRSLMKMMATTLAVVILLTAFGTSAHAGLFTRLKDTVKDNPVKSALAGVAAVGVQFSLLHTSQVQLVSHQVASQESQVVQPQL